MDLPCSVSVAIYCMTEGLGSVKNLLWVADIDIDQDVSRHDGALLNRVFPGTKMFKEW